MSSEPLEKEAWKTPKKPQWLGKQCLLNTTFSKPLIYKARESSLIQERVYDGSISAETVDL